MGLRLRLSLIVRKANSVCADPECAEVCKGQYCEAHQRKQWVTNRQRWHRNLYPPDWPERKAKQLTAYPHCQHADDACKCEGQCPAVAVEVDHIITLAYFPRTRAGAIAASDPLNLQSLCSYCHRFKTMREDYPRLKRNN